MEDPSTEAAVRLLIPKIVEGISFEVYAYQCKQDLLGKLPARLRGYAAWLPPEWRIVVVVDRDDDDCIQLKAKLKGAVDGASLSGRADAKRSGIRVLTRIAVEELEAWFFGDWVAVQTAYPGVSPNVPAKQGFRDCDAIAGGTWESLERLLQRAGYFKTGLRKIEAARAIAQHMEPRRNRSRSFQCFAAGLNRLACQQQG